MRELGEDAVSEFRESGYVVVPEAFDPESVRGALNDVLREHAARGGKPYLGGHRPNIATDARFRFLIKDQALVRFAWRFHGSRSAYASMGLNVVPAGSPGMLPHVDYPYFQRMPKSSFPALCVQMIWYLNDVTERSAPTAVVPGSHLLLSKPDASFADRAVPILAKAGTLFIGHGVLWHSVMPNLTEEDRPAVVGSYVPYCRTRCPGNCAHDASGDPVLLRPLLDHPDV